MSAPAAAQAQPSWIVPDLLAPAKAEGELIVYGSMNEEEALPFWQLFQDASGVKVSYVRASDANILARIAIEYRARQRSWDLVATTPVYRLPDEVLLQFDPPEAKSLIPQARARQPALVRRLRQLQCAFLQHQFRQEGGPAEDL